MSPEDPDTPEILVVEDDLSLQRSLVRVLVQEGYAVSSYEHAESMLAALMGRQPTPRPLCLLLDLNLGGMSGIDAQRLARQLRPGMPVVFMSAQQDPKHINQAWRDGAVDFLFKPFSAQDLLQTLERALTQSRQRAAAAPWPDIDPDLQMRVQALTPRQRQVLAAVANGLTHAQIAQQLEISARTVKLHRAAMMQRLRCRTLADLVRLYESCKHLLQPQETLTLH